MRRCPIRRARNRFDGHGPASPSNYAAATATAASRADPADVRRDGAGRPRRALGPVRRLGHARRGLAPRAPHVARARALRSGSAPRSSASPCSRPCVQAIFDRRTNDGTTFVMFFLVIAAPIVILNRILRHRVIGRETILGAVCVYVLLGIVFAGIYGAINDIDGGQFFAQRVVQSNVDFLYFSFVVLTTLGFGDLTPKPDIAARHRHLRGADRPGVPRDARGAADVPVRHRSGVKRPTRHRRHPKRRRLRARGVAPRAVPRSAPRPCAGCRR